MMQRRHFFTKILTLSIATAVILVSPIAFAQWAEETFKENPSPFTASSTLGELAVPQVKSRIKMGKQSDVVAVVKMSSKAIK